MFLSSSNNNDCATVVAPVFRIAAVAVALNDSFLASTAGEVFGCCESACFSCTSVSDSSGSSGFERFFSGLRQPVKCLAAVSLHVSVVVFSCSSSDVSTSLLVVPVVVVL